MSMCKKYELDAITISGCVIRTKPTIYLVNYCVADFSNGIFNIEEYLLDDGSLNLKKFYNHFPDVQNLNDLLAFLRSKGRQIDEEKIVCI